MSHRFFSASRIEGNHVTLDGPEAHHLLHVMRLGVGDEVTLFDGHGAEFQACIDTVGRGTAGLVIQQRQDIDRELNFQLTLAVALPKGDRQRWLVEKTVELGVSRIVPLRTTRGVAQPAAKPLERLRRAVIEASKQCGRNRLAEIVPAVAFSDLIASQASVERRLIAHPHDASRPLARCSAQAPKSSVVVAVGPEGGFTDDEFAAARNAEWQPVHLGPRILRVDTAAVALVAAIAAGEQAVI